MGLQMDGSQGTTMGSTLTANEGVVFKFSVVCEDLQLSSPKSEHYLHGNKGRKTEHRPSSRTSQLTQPSFLLNLIPQTKLLCWARCKP